MIKEFDGGQLSKEEKELRDFYKRLLNFTINSDALMGNYQDIHYYNRDHTENYNHRVLSYVRWSENEKLIVVANFDSNENYRFELKIPNDIINYWGLKNGFYSTVEQLYNRKNSSLEVKDGIGIMKIEIEPLESFIFKIQ